MSRSPSLPSETSVSGPLRIGQDPRVLARRLRRGDVAVIDRVDLDGASAALLAQRQPAAVINVSPSLSGRFAAKGAATLLARGVPLYDAADRTLLAAPEGEDVRVSAGSDGAQVLAAADASYPVVRVTSERVAEQTQAAAAGTALRVSALAAGTLDIIQRDGHGLVDADPVPGLSLDLDGKDVLVVAAGEDYVAQLKAVRRAVKERGMVVLTTGDAAQTVASSHKVAAIVGPVEAVPDAVLAHASRVVVHGEALTIAATRLGALGVPYVTSESRLDSADLAVAIAAAGGARMIATVGMSATLPELVDSAHGASALVARMAAGTAWIDGRMLASLYRSRWSRVQGWLWIALATAALAGALALHPAVSDRAQDLWERLS